MGEDDHVVLPPLDGGLHRVGTELLHGDHLTQQVASAGGERQHVSDLEGAGLHGGIVARIANRARHGVLPRSRRRAGPVNARLPESRREARLFVSDDRVDR